MVSFQQDILLTINLSNENYLTKIKNTFENDKLLSDLTINHAEKLIEYIKEYKTLINSTCLVLDKINNIKNTDNLNLKIETELMTKMLPIMNVYRTLLLEKYSKVGQSSRIVSTINDQD
jgi:hypothetical protein